MVAPANLESYADAQALFNTCRSPAAGKPLPGGWRLLKTGDTFVVGYPLYRGGFRPICKLTPDNVLEFTLPHDQMLSMSNSLVMVLWKVVPFHIQRKRTGVYEMGQLQSSRTSYGYMYPSLGSGKYEYFEGVKFDILTGECINPKPDLVDTAIPGRKREWIRVLKTYKKGLRIRAKMGALEGYVRAIQKEAEEADSQWQYRQSYPPLGDPRFGQQLLECMKREEYPPEILKRFALEAMVFGWRQHLNPSPQDILKAIDSVFDRHSLLYRKRFGVFGDEHMIW